MPDRRPARDQAAIDRYLTEHDATVVPCGAYHAFKNRRGQLFGLVLPGEPDPSATPWQRRRDTYHERAEQYRAASDGGRRTAGEIAEIMGVSRSGAVTYLRRHKIAYAAETADA